MGHQQLIDEARTLIRFYEHGDNANLLSEMKKKFISLLVKEKNPENLYLIIKEDAQSLSLPMDILKLIFDQFNSIGERTERVLNWYASMLRLYGEPSDLIIAEKLIAEAKMIQKKSK